MEDPQKFEIIIKEIKNISDDVKNIRKDIESIKIQMYILGDRIEKFENRTLNIDLVLEHETNKRLKKLDISHSDLLQIIYSKTNQIEKMETELSQIKEYIQNIQKAPDKKNQ